MSNLQVILSKEDKEDIEYKLWSLSYTDTEVMWIFNYLISIGYTINDNGNIVERYLDPWRDFYESMQGTSTIGCKTPRNTKLT